MISYTQLDNGRYPISCKIYAPDDSTAKGVILGIHGFAGDKESPALAMLAERSNREGIALVCFDFPAHGKSAVGEDELTVGNCIRDVLFMADYCREVFPVKDRRIFATSFGGYIALLCADQLADFHMVLRAPAVTIPEHILLDILGMTAEMFKTKSPVQCGFERPIMLPYSFYEDLCQHRVMDREYSDPMLIIHGNRDDIVPRADIEGFCSLHPTMRPASIDGADHRFKNPGELEKAIELAIRFWNGENGV